MPTTSRKCPARYPISPPPTNLFIFSLKTPSLTQPIYVTAILLLTAFALSRLVSVAANLTAALLFHPCSTLWKKKTVCSKDFNLPANLYDFLLGGDTEPVQGRRILPLHVKRLWESFQSSLLAEFEFFSALGKERKKNPLISMHQLSLADSSKVKPKGVSVCICLMMMLVTLRLSHFFPSPCAVYSVAIILRKLFASCARKAFAHPLFSRLAEQHVSVIIRRKQQQPLQQQLHWQRCLSSVTHRDVSKRCQLTRPIF